MNEFLEEELERQGDRMLGKLWRLYYAIYYLPKDEVQAFFNTAPSSVITAFADIQQELYPPRVVEDEDLA